MVWPQRLGRRLDSRRAGIRWRQTLRRQRRQTPAQRQMWATPQC